MLSLGLQAGLPTGQQLGRQLGLTAVAATAAYQQFAVRAAKGPQQACESWSQDFLHGFCVLLDAMEIVWSTHLLVAAGKRDPPAARGLEESPAL